MGSKRHHSLKNKSWLKTGRWYEVILSIKKREFCLNFRALPKHYSVFYCKIFKEHFNGENPTTLHNSNIFLPKGGMFVTLYIVFPYEL